MRQRSGMQVCLHFHCMFIYLLYNFFLVLSLTLAFRRCTMCVDATFSLSLFLSLSLSRTKCRIVFEVRHKLSAIVQLSSSPTTATRYLFTNNNGLQHVFHVFICTFSSSHVLQNASIEKSDFQRLFACLRASPKHIKTFQIKQKRKRCDAKARQRTEK